VKGDLTMGENIDDLSGGVEHGCLVPGFHSQAHEGILLCRANLGVPAVGRTLERVAPDGSPSLTRSKKTGQSQRAHDCAGITVDGLSG
jgi:hypothetical protein